MKNKIFLLICLLFANITLFAVDFNTLPDETVIATLGEDKITVFDLKLYILGYSEIDKWTNSTLEPVFNRMLRDLLFYKGAFDEGIFVEEFEVNNYAEKFFSERSINFEDQAALEIYFKNNNPYYDITDFSHKVRLELYRIKYLAKKGYIKEGKIKHIFLSTERLNQLKRKRVKQTALNIAYMTRKKEYSFQELVKKYSQDDSSKQKNGDLNIISAEEIDNPFFYQKNIQYIFSFGIFNPVLVEGKKGYNIAMCYDIPEFEDEIIRKELKILYEKYDVKFMIKF